MPVLTQWVLTATLTSEHESDALIYSLRGLAYSPDILQPIGLSGISCLGAPKGKKVSIQNIFFFTVKSVGFFFLSGNI